MVFELERAKESPGELVESQIPGASSGMALMLLGRGPHWFKPEELVLAFPGGQCLRLGLLRQGVWV